MQFFQNVWDTLREYYTLLLEGLGLTMLIAIIGTVVGLVIGLILGVVRTIPKAKTKAGRVVQAVGNFIINAYVEIFRGTPMMVQAMVIFWGYAYLMGGQTLDKTLSGIFIVSINTGAYMTEIVRGGIISIDKGQIEGAHAVGMNHFQTMFHVIIPQVMRNILPSVSNEFVINIKDTSVLNVIGVKELYFYMVKIQTFNLQIFEPYLIVCVIYFIMTFTITRILRFIEKKLAGKNSYVICGSQSDSASEITVTEDVENA